LPKDSNADSVLQAHTANDQCAQQLITKSYAATSLPIGWTDDAKAQFYAPGCAWLLFIAGWFLTALAASLGAPFWFDLLNKTLSLNTRLTGAKPKVASST